MYLSELKLAGFKSFADRTRLNLQQGVAVIVGPNGSGKSNLVDAIAWVMGTQSPKALRTQKMDDVIFAGTATRPALGRAEVTLIFDNQDGALPLDLDEVSITRRLYRDGTSEYLISGTECRLTDIQELLFDSGVGRHQHTIVGQGEIDAILSASAQDHRAVIEEAAGVLKHRVRKERALRRLERTGADLVRLADIERELTRQIRPLKRQAKAAERYEALRAEARALRLHVDGRDLQRVGDELAEAQEEEGALVRREEQAAAEFGRETVAGTSGEKAVTEARTALEADTGAAARLETSRERFRRIAQVAHERLAVAKDHVERAEERYGELQSEKAAVDSALEADRRIQQRLAVEVESAAARADALASEERVLADQASMVAEGVAAMLRGEISGFERSDERDRTERSELATKLQVLADRLEATRANRQRLEEEIRSLDEAASEASRTYETVRESSRLEQRRWERAEESLAETRLTLAGAEAGVAALEEASGSRKPDAALETPGVSGFLVELLDCPPRLVAALRIALGSWAEAVALEPGSDLTDVLDELKRRGAPSLSVVRDLEASSAETPAERAGLRWGVEPLAAALGPRARTDLARALLGDVLLVESWSAGWQLVAREEGVRAVTPEGDLISTEGVALHDSQRGIPQLLEESRGELEAFRTETARHESLLAAAKRSFDTIRTSEREALEALERTEALLAGATEALDRSAREEAEQEAEHDLLAARLSVVEQTMSSRAAHLEVLRGRLARMEEEGPESKQLREETARRRDDVAKKRRLVEAQRDRAAADMAAALERVRIAEERQGAITDELRAFESPVQAEDLDRLSNIQATAGAALSIVSSHIDVLQDRERVRRAELTEKEKRLTVAISERDRLSREITQMRERRTALAVRLTELRLRVESIAEGLRRDLDATAEDALAADVPQLEPDVSPHARLEELEAQLRRVGPVNPLASEEYRELSDRASFLAGQMEDVESSRRKLSGLIATLDAEIAELFRSAFEQVASLFEEHFQLLFPGGRGKLRLTDPDDLLSTGVEILAQPMGKRVSRLSLLSGGEKSLAALAFLFAVFRARPSPFYLLDEVEAALDDANLRRFLRLLGEIRFDAQLIIVTHQQQTMEAADVLYGITLEPGGSTQVVGKQLVAV
ncbi:MAG: chromosome segregation protein SMC [Acidimicrobiia bacterium]